MYSFIHNHRPHALPVLVQAQEQNHLDLHSSNQSKWRKSHFFNNTNNYLVTAWMSVLRKIECCENINQSPLSWLRKFTYGFYGQNPDLEEEEEERMSRPRGGSRAGVGQNLKKHSR